MSKEIINVQMDKEYYESVIGNVPQEGGGGSNVRYFKPSADFDMGNMYITEIGMMGGQTIKWKDTDDTIRFECGNSYANNIDKANLHADQRYIGALAMALIDAPVNIFMNGTWMEQNLVEYISQVVEGGALIEITKEEFYNTIA